MTISANITVLVPELIMAIGAMVLLLFGAIRGEKGISLVSSLAIIVMAAAAWFVVMPVSHDPHAFGGAFVVDDFARFAKILILLGSAATLLMAQDFLVSQGLDKLVHAGQLTSWRQGIYEAETTAFGGTEAMAVAHDLFRADSQAILTHAPAAGRREISLILSGALMQGAGLEWYERGDLWRRVSSERPLPADVTATNINALAAQMRPLMLAASDRLGYRGAVIAAMGGGHTPERATENIVRLGKAMPTVVSPRAGGGGPMLRKTSN